MSTVNKRISVSHPVFRGNEKQYVAECIDTVWISSIGKFIPLFENAFSSFCGVKHAIACNNGTSALHIALLALGIGPGDEVLVPTLTYVAAANAIHYCGATPVFVDSDIKTMNIDPHLMESAITPQTRAILVVHLYGQPADMDEIMAIARRHGLFVIEDAAEAHGAKYKDKTVGSIGDIGTFSFFGNKIVTTGEGGMAVTNDSELEAKMRLFKGQGMDSTRRYWFPVIGYNYRMTNIQAALGLAQMECIEEHIAAHRQVASWYQEYLKPRHGTISLPLQHPDRTHAIWLYTVVLGDDIKRERDTIMSDLAQKGIETRPVFYPMHTMPPYYEQKSYPVAELLARRGISLPTHGLLTEEDIRYIADSLQTACGN